MDEPKFTGCVVPARLIRPNDHRIAVAAQSKDDSDLKRIDDLNQNMLKEIEPFLIAYNQERGRSFACGACVIPEPSSWPRGACYSFF